MEIAVFGASGRTGEPLLAQALDRGHEVVAFVRDASKLPAELRADERVRIVEGDAYTGEGVEQAIGGDGAPVDAVVSVLGQHSNGPDDLLTAASKHVLAAMEQHDVSRYVTLVGAGVREAGEPVSAGGKVMGAMLKLLAREVLEDAREHVEVVRASDTDWTVVRGPRLTDGPQTEHISHGTELSLGMRDSASRANVAALILDSLEGDLYVREMPKVADA